MSDIPTTSMLSLANCMSGNDTSSFFLARTSMFSFICSPMRILVVSVLHLMAGMSCACPQNGNAAAISTNRMPVPIFLPLFEISK